MRQYKFRAWDKKLKKFVEPILNHVTLNDFFILGFYELQQFTGRLDKYGKEIYSGDIVKSNCYPFYGLDGNFNYLGEVYYCEYNAGYYLNYHRISNRVSGNVVNPLLVDYADLEIIGNIYENPELLENKDE